MRFDIEHMASEHSQQDWNRLEYASVCRKGYIQGAKDAIEHYGLQYTQSQAKRMHEALEMLVTEESEMAASCEAWSAADALLAELERGE